MTGSISSKAMLRRDYRNYYRLLGAIAVLIVSVAVMKLTPSEQDFPAGISGLFDVAGWINGGEDWLRDNYRWLTREFSSAINNSLEQVEEFLLYQPWPFIFLIFVLPVLACAGLRMAAVVIFCIALWGIFDQWDAAMQTLALMTVSVLLACLVGIPLGIACSQNRRVERVVNPVLDAMQTLPAFVYLVPALFFFGIGGATAILATVIYAMPPVIRMTNLGLRQVPHTILEAAQSFGPTNRQLLWRVKFPTALPSVIIGINQTVMMALGLVVLASLIGAPGLGAEIWQALQKLDVGLALEGGICIVSMAILLDRLGVAVGEAHAGQKRAPVTAHFLLLPQSWASLAPVRAIERLIAAIQQAVIGVARTTVNLIADALAQCTRLAGGGADHPLVLFIRRHVMLVFGLLIIIFFDLFDGWFLHIGSFPEAIQISISKPVNEVTRWLTVNPGFIAFTKGLTWFLFTYLLNPLRQLLMEVPWWYLTALVTLVAWLSGRRPLALLALTGLLVMGVSGQWVNSMETLASVLVSVFVCVLIGVPIGILAAYNRTVDAMLRPVLDTMQTLPAFVYLVPVIMFFGGNIVSALIATVIYAVPPIVRLTTLGIRQLPMETTEVVNAFGSRTLPALWRVKLPMAIPSIAAGLNQTIMMVLAMQVITPLVGGRGLGKEVFHSLGLADTGRGLVAGICIVLMAIILDRLILAWSFRQRQAMGLLTE